MSSSSSSSSSSDYLIRGLGGRSDDELFSPSFDSASQCRAWLHSIGYPNRVTNPSPIFGSSCKHIYTTLCDWEQVCEYLLKPLALLRAQGKKTSSSYTSSSSSSSTSDFRPVAQPGVPASNVFANEPAILSSINSRLDLPFHKRTNEESTLNTLRYLFFHMKCGIFVKIQDNKLVMFIPFVNKDFRNTWANRIIVDAPGNDLKEYVDRKKDALVDLGKRSAAEKEVLIEDRSRWWANGNIMCNVDSEGFWGDNYLPQLRNMLVSLCSERSVQDCEFFINKRDFPQLKRNISEPYDFIYDKDDEPLSREKYSTYSPIASFFVGPDFADLPLVTTDDWETATGKVFPPVCAELRSAKKREENDVPWEKRVCTAFFRGNSTGPGTDAITNQRIRLAKISTEWETASDTGANAVVSFDPKQRCRFLDAGLVGWNMRDRKLQGEPMTFIKPSTLGIQLVEKVPMYAQAKFKYHVYVDGHCAAMRYASMMPLGAVILKVISATKAESMWYFPLLQPYDFRSTFPNPLGDHIPVKSDLSDLKEVISWCRKHDKECEKIALNSKSLFRRLIAREGQLDYMQLLCCSISQRFQSSQQSAPIDPLKLEKPNLAAPPSRSIDDWFSADCLEYTDVLLSSSSTSGPPVMKKYATKECVCPSCDRKRETKDGKGLKSLATSLPTSHTANAGKKVSTASTMSSAPVVASDKARAAFLKAAQLAAERSASGGGGGAGGGGVKRPRL